MKKIITIALFSAGLFLMPSCEYLMTSYDFDTNPNHLSDVNLMDYVNSGQDTTLTEYAAAVAYTGLDESFHSTSPTTVLVPNNAAFRSLKKNAGVRSLEEIDRNVLRQLLLYCVFPGKINTYEMPVDTLFKIETLSGDPILAQRTINGTDRYRLTFNPVQKNDPEFGSQQFLPYQQDLILKDVSSHIVDFFPLYAIKCRDTDPAPQREDGGSVRWDLSGDTHYYPGNTGAPKYNLENQVAYRTASGQSRTTLLQFDKFDLPFETSMIFKATLNVYVKTNNSSGPLVTTLSCYDMTNLQDRRPIREINKGNISLKFDDYRRFADIENIATGAWNSADVTEKIRSVFEDESTTDFFFGIRPATAQKHASGTIYIGWLNEDKPTVDNKASYITIVRYMDSELTVTPSSLECPAGGMAILGKEHICATCEIETEFTYTDNNILYELSSQPEHGVLTKNNLPLGTGVTFTQEQLDKGLIKYFNKDGKDDQIVFHVTDYTMAVVPEDKIVNVKIK